jgi:UPF0271 protein
MNPFKIDLNLDAGESPEALHDGSEEALYQWVTSVNIACGGHAGDAETMSQAVELAQKYHLAIGAHPSFPDRENFGRKILKISRDELIDSLTEQIESLKKVCQRHGVRLTHVKPHGALYNLAANDLQTSQAIITAVQRLDSSLAVVGLAGSQFLNWSQEARVKSFAEAFPDRRYENSGSLRSRQFSDALIENSEQAAEQALQMVCNGTVKAVDGTILPIQAETLCVHGDSPNALATARAVHQALRGAGVILSKL